MMPDEQIAKLQELLDFIEFAPENEIIIDMDCNDHCEQLAQLAEQVASGVDLGDILPELQKHMQYWGDCREEFMALVNVLKAEISGDLADLPRSDL